MSDSRDIAVIGSGYWGKNLVRVFHELGRLRTVCDANPAVRADVEKKYSPATYAATLEEVLADDGVKAVAIATPAVTHVDVARRAMLAGKDVYVEKPLALSVEDGASLIKLASERGRILMVGHILQYHPAVLKLAELIKKGELGRIRYVYSNRLNIGKIRQEENILWSFAPHDISVILGLLGEEPVSVACSGSGYLNAEVADVTVSQFLFHGGVRAHIFVSWLNPFKEQRLVVVGETKMAVFDDTIADKLVLYPHKVEWINRMPSAVKAEGEKVLLDAAEPLKAECSHFLDCVASRKAPRTDGQEGLRVLKVLDACERSMKRNGEFIELASPRETAYHVHETACVDRGAQIGKGTKVWHFAHVLPGAKIGERCILGQNVNVDGGAVIGNNVKIQNNVSVYSGVTVEDDVFLGPSCVLTNVTNPRSQVNRHSIYEKIHLKRGATVGANATICPGVTLGRYAFVAAGAVVTKDAADYALVVGNPARQVGWMSRHGHRLGKPDSSGVMTCPESGFRYKESAPGALRCLDLDEDAPLPAHLTKGTKAYDEFKIP